MNFVNYPAENDFPPFPNRCPPFHHNPISMILPAQQVFMCHFFLFFAICWLIIVNENFLTSHRTDLEIALKHFAITTTTNNNKDFILTIEKKAFVARS